MHTPYHKLQIISKVGFFWHLAEAEEDDKGEEEEAASGIEDGKRDADGDRAVVAVLAILARHLWTGGGQRFQNAQSGRGCNKGSQKKNAD